MRLSLRTYNEEPITRLSRRALFSNRGRGGAVQVSDRPRRARMFSFGYLPISKTENEPATMGPRAGRPAGPGGALGAAGSNSADIVNRWPVLGSSTSVLAPVIVSR